VVPLATNNKDFRVKNGLIVEGTTATVFGNDILTEASSIDDLVDVDASGAETGDTLVFDTSSNTWTAAAPGVGALSLDDLNDVNVSEVSDGQALVYSSGSNLWIPGAGGGGGGASFTISSTAPTSPSPGDVWYDSVNGNSYIYYNDEDSSQWVEFIGSPGPTGLTGAQGGQGEQGIQGDPGLGIPIGGSTGQILTKSSSTDYETSWSTNSVSNLSDTTISTLSSDQLLRWNGTVWVNDTAKTNSIADNAIIDSKIANDAVTETKIINNAVTTNKINNNAVTADKINNDAVTENKIFNNAVTTNKINNDAVTFGKLQDISALSVVGRSANSLGDAGNISAGIDGHVLRRVSSVLGFGQIVSTSIQNSAVTREKINANAMLGFTAQVTFAANTTWSVPALARTLVKVTVIGGGGGGGGGQGNSSTLAGAGGNGGVSTFNAGAGGSFSAAGGVGGLPAVGNSSALSTPGFASGNGGQGGQTNNEGNARGQGLNGNGGAMIVRYVNLSGVSTVGITIGPGGTAGAAGGNGRIGDVGGDGSIIVEYVAG
jgi:hypothetical protein